MKIFRNCIIIGLFAAFMFLLLELSNIFFLPQIPLCALAAAAVLVFIVFELGILSGVIITKISRASGKSGSR